MATNTNRLTPAENQALETISRLLELAKFHLVNGNENPEEIREALIDACDKLSAIPIWIAQGTGPDFAPYIEARLAAVVPALVRIEADDFPDPPGEV